MTARLAAWFFVLLALWTVVATALLFGNGSAVFPELVTALLGFPGLSSLSASQAVNTYLFLLLVLVVALSIFIAWELLKLSRRGFVYGLVLDGLLLGQVALEIWQKIYPRNIFDYVVIGAELAVLIYLLKDEKRFTH